MTTATESNSTTMTTTRVSKCPDCGLKFELQEADNVSEWIRAALPDPVVYCDACAEKKSAAAARETKRFELSQRLGTLLNKGLVTQEFRETRWESSSRDIEARQHSVWSQGRAWWRNCRKNLFVHGPVGVGKTRLARACLHEAFENGHNVAEVTATEQRRFAGAK